MPLKYHQMPLNPSPGRCELTLDVATLEQRAAVLERGAYDAVFWMCDEFYHQLNTTKTHARVSAFVKFKRNAAQFKGHVRGGVGHAKQGNLGTPEINILLLHPREHFRRRGSFLDRLIMHHVVEILLKIGDEMRVSVYVSIQSVFVQRIFRLMRVPYM